MLVPLLLKTLGSWVRSSICTAASLKLRNSIVESVAWHHYPLGDLINNCYGKSQMHLIRDFPIVDLRKKLKLLTSRCRQVLDMYRLIKLSNNNTWWTELWIICLAKHQDFLTNCQFLMKRTQQKIRNQTIDKTMAKPACVVKIHKNPIFWNGTM